MRPLGRILEVKQHERGTCVRRLTVKTKPAVLKHPIDRIAPRVQINIVDPDVPYDQSLFSVFPCGGTQSRQQRKRDSEGEMRVAS